MPRSTPSPQRSTCPTREIPTRTRDQELVAARVPNPRSTRARRIPKENRSGTSNLSAVLVTAAPSALRLRFTLDDDPLVDADAHLVVGPFAPSDELGRLVLVGWIGVGVIEVRLHLEPRPLRHADRLFKSVGALPVEVPMADLDQR